MKKIITCLSLIVAMTSFVIAETTILTVDLEKVFREYNKAKESTEAFRTALESAQAESQRMLEEGNKLAEELKLLSAKSSNPALTEDARAAAATEAETLSEEIRKKQREFNEYRQQMQQTLNVQNREVSAQHIEEIKAKVAEIAQAKGAKTVLNTTGQLVLYAEDSLDITDEVLSNLNQ